MNPQSNKWYSKEQAEGVPSLSCYALKLYTVDDRILDGFYYKGKFYNKNDMDITSWIEAWLIPQKGEQVHMN